MPKLTALRESPAIAAFAEAWRWWTGELTAMLPARFRPDPARKSSAAIRPGRNKVEIEIVRDGVGQLFADSTPLEDMGAEGWAELAALVEGSRTHIVLSSPDVFVTGLALPKAARRRLRSAVALQLSQTAPVAPELLRWAMVAKDAGANRLDVRVAMARAEHVDRLQGLFEANAIAPPPVSALTDDGLIELAPGRRLGGAAGYRLLASPWAIAALLFASIPITTAMGATLLRAAAESRIDSLEKGAAPRLKAEAAARRSEALRRDLRPLATRPGVTATIEELAARLPLTDHVKSVEQGGDRILRIAVETTDAEAAEAALKGSRLLPYLAVTDIAPAANGRLAVALRTSPR